MGISRKQDKILDFINNQVTLWKWSKDIDSLSNSAAISDNIDNLHLSNDEFLELESIMKDLYYFIQQHK